MAERVGVSLRGWQKNERDEAVPSGDTLLKIRELDINPGWVLTGDGDMSANQAKARGQEALPIHPDLMPKLGELVETTLKEEKMRIPHLEVFVETGKAYNDLRSLVDDLTDSGAVEEALPLVKRRLIKRLNQPAADTNSRKYSA